MPDLKMETVVTSKLTTNWDALLASSPLNKQAAVDANSKEGGFVPRKQIYQEWDFHSHAPFKIRPATTGIDLTGMKVGKLTVIGLKAIEGEKRKTKAAWVVRCVCGNYETRKAKALRDPEYAKRASCAMCDYTTQMLAGNVNVELKLTLVTKE